MKVSITWCLSIVVYCWSMTGFVAGCPVDVSGYTKWSTEYGNGNEQLSTTANVTITKKILLDVTEVELFSINIEQDGELFFSNDIDISLRVRYILIGDGGIMTIGTEQCKHTSKVLITLTGKLGEYKIPNFDEKFIGVQSGGTIEIHGEYKLPWTKLTRTVQKVDKDHGIIYQHSEDPTRIDFLKGVVIHVFDRGTGENVANLTEKLVFSMQHKTDAAILSIQAFLEGVRDGKVVALAVQKNPLEQNNDLTKLYQLVESLTGSNAIYNLEPNSAYAVITVKGNTTTTKDQLATGDIENIATVEMIDDIKSKRYLITSAINSERVSATYVDFLVTDTKYSMPIIKLQNDVSSWKVGELVVVTSTDYKWQQREIFELIPCESCTVKQVRLASAPKYTHFAEFCEGINKLDMRGEVGLLTRNIKIMGETTEEEKFGGHIKMLQGFKNAKFEGLELYHMGQNNEIGHYPLHCHMCHDIRTNDSSNPTKMYIRGTSIHNTFARGITVHGTHGMHIHHNFIFDTLGHGIFLEDGGEQFNKIDFNLVGGQRITKLIPSDTRPTSYWVTNPKNYVTNNIACGSDGVGFWFLFPDKPVAVSQNAGFMEEFEAKHTAFYQFDNNVAHSNVKAGLFFDNRLMPNHDLKGYNQYNPREDPFNTSSPPKEVFLKKFTAFKNEKQNAWARGGKITLEQCSISDSKIGVGLTRENFNRQVLRNCLVVGESCNLGEPEYGTDRSHPGHLEASRIGVHLLKGPTVVYDVWFQNFTNKNYYNASAITPEKKDSFHHTTPVHSVFKVLFGFDDSSATGNRVWDALSDYSFDADYISTFRDLDGSVTGLANQQVLPLHDFLLTKDCTTRKNWEMAICPRLYGTLHVRRHPTTHGEQEADMRCARDDDPTLIDNSIMPNTTTKFGIILGGEFSYIMEYLTEMPSGIRIDGKGIEKSKWLRFGLCIPRDAKFEIIGNRIHDSEPNNFMDWKNVSSVEEVDNDETSESYYFDKEVGVIFFRMKSLYDRLPVEDYEDCPSNSCPRIFVNINEGDLTDCECIDRAYDKYKRTVTVGEPRVIPDIIPASASAPPTDWGAGKFPAVTDYTTVVY